MATHQIAQGLAGLGRGKDTMLMHVTPNEVAGLQNLAMAKGGTLTINPDTGLPEAGFFDGLFEAVAPIGLGMLLGPAGLGMSALGAGLATGVAGFALSGGDVMSGLTSGLGGFGGAGLGKSLGTIGKTATIPQVSPVGLNTAATAAGETAKQAALASNASLPAGSELLRAPAGAGLAAKQSILNAPGVASTNLIGGASPYSFSDIGTGAKEVFSDPMKYWKSGQIGWQDAATVGLPVLSAAMKTPEYKIPEDTSYKMKYEGPYTAQDRAPRTPTLEEQASLRAQGSPEYSYFGDANPYPGFNKAPGYADGGYVSNDMVPPPQLSQDGYGLGRLNAMAQGGMSGYADGGAIAFDNGGQVPYVGSPSYGVAPTDLSQVAAIPTAGGTDPGTSAIQGILGNAITDPMGRTSGQPVSGMGGKGMANPTGANNQYSGGVMNKLFGQLGVPGMMGKGGVEGTAPRALTMQDYINQARRVYDPAATAQTLSGIGTPEMAQFSNINPQQPVAKAMGGGIHALKSGGSPSQGGFLDGEGDGMSDSIPATIGEKQPARLADGEFVVPADVVSHLGNGSTKAGAKHLYKMMDKVRHARTGNKKQGKQINPNKFVPA